MLDDAEHAAGLQRGVHRLERLALPAEHHPVVQVAEGHDQVGRAGRRDLVRRRRRGQRRHDDLVVEIRPRRELGAEGVDGAAGVFARRGIEVRGVQLAASRSSGARISVYQPPPGHTSTTVMSGRRPKN